MISASSRLFRRNKLMQNRKIPLICSFLFLLLSTSCSPSDFSSSRNISDSDSSVESSTSSEAQHPVQEISFFGFGLYIEGGDYAWLHFKNRFSENPEFAIYIHSAKPVCLEPYHEKIEGFSPENRKEVALTGAFHSDGQEYEYYSFYDFYLPREEEIYFRVSPRGLYYIHCSVCLHNLDSLVNFMEDSEGNYFLKGLHVHELTFYSCDPFRHDYDPRLGHYHICWKGDLSVFEEHEFSFPYTGSDGKSYVSCSKCHFTMPVYTGIDR